MDLTERYEKNEAKIRKLQEENKELLRKRKEQERKEHLAYLEKQDEIIRSVLEKDSEKNDLGFLEYALGEVREKLQELYKEWTGKN